MRLFIKNRVFSITGSSKVYNEAGEIEFIVKGSVFSPRRKKKICTPGGEVLYVVKNKLLNFYTHRSWVFSPDGEKLAEVSNKGFSISFQVDGYDDQINVQGHWFQRAELFKNGIFCGYLNRSYQRASDLFRDAFELNVFDQDVPFWVALVIAIDNILDNKTN